MSISSAKILANQRNAAKSTGPKTLAGKRASSANATRHAIFSVAPVLPEVERAEEWAAHRNALVEDLAPEGYLETLLVDRIATLFWRLGRVTRYETENAASRLETTDHDLTEASRAETRFTVPCGFAKETIGHTPREMADELEFYKEKVLAFAQLREGDRSESFPPEFAETILYDVADLAEVDLDEIPDFPFIPTGEQIITWKGWTKGLVLEAVAILVASSSKASTRGLDPDELLQAGQRKAAGSVYRITEAKQQAEEKRQRLVRSRVLLQADELGKVTRYETHLERSLYKALHELQRLQALRNGTGTAPLALDVDVSLGLQRKEPETHNVIGVVRDP